MTLTPKLANLRARSTSERLERLVPRLAVGVGNVIAGQRPDADERQKAEDAPGVRRKGWITDPTGEMAVGKLLAVDVNVDAVDNALATAAAAVEVLEVLIARFAPTIVEKRRCGEYSPSDIRQHPEFRGDCTNHADSVTTSAGATSWRSTGVCAACRSRIERHDRTAAA